MNRISRDMKVLMGKLGPQRVRLLLVILTIILFVLGAGAPETSGGWGGG